MPTGSGALATDLNPAVRKLTVDISDHEVEDLRSRLRNTRWPDLTADDEWEYGANLPWIQQFCHFWSEEFDWYRHQRQLNAADHYQIEIDGCQLHFQHVRGQGSEPTPLLLTHGWPSTYHEMHRLIGPLTDPVGCGESGVMSFDVVIPSLPGFGFSNAPPANEQSDGRSETLAQAHARIGL